MSEATGRRLSALDALRGLIMVVMALDHAAFFAAGVHPAEFWAGPLPDYGHDAGWFFTRWVTHLCAPGFALLMGAGAALYAASRKEMGWTEVRVGRQLVWRGVFLMVACMLFENVPQIALGMLPAGDFLAVGVLMSLGFSLAMCGLLGRLSTRSWLAMGFIAILAPDFLIPTLKPDAAVGYLLRIFVVPGETAPVVCGYPLLPWFGVTALGMGLGRWLQADPRRVLRASLGMGIAYLVAFLGIRVGGGFGNLRLSAEPGWMGFLTVVKYPPSLAFVLLFVGLNLVLLSLLERAGAWLDGVKRVLSVYGQAPLFFYLTHFYVLGVVGHYGLGGKASRPVLYLTWLAVVVALYPACRWFRAFKLRKPADSMWRMA